MLQDMSMVDFKELVDYYMRTGGSHRHSWQWFANHYDELVESKKERDADIETREKLREQTKRRTEEWRQKKVDNNSRETD